MKEFTLELLFRLSVGAASGLHFFANDLFIISDNSSFLYRYSFENRSGTKLPLLVDAADLIPKPQKPDFESIAFDNGNLFVFGSGSTDKRNLCTIIDVKSDASTVNDLSGLYHRMRQKSGITAADLNIEGAVFKDDKLLMFQRGNGLASQNGVFIIEKASAFSKRPQLRYEPVELPMINGIQSTFTDAVMVDGKLYYLATAENSASTYLDGEVAGSLIGTLDNDFLPTESLIIGKQKFEGITLYSVSDTSISFLICEDNDSDQADAGIFLLTVRK